MPRANINLNPQYKANQGYSGFDMSQSVDFTSSVGQLLPVYYDILSPGDKVDCRAVLKSRTAPINTAASMKVTEHVEWFFVPLEQLYKPFGNFYYGVQDFQSSLFYPNMGTAKKIDSLPFGNLYEIIGSDGWTMFKSEKDQQSDSYMRGFYRLCDCLGLPIGQNISMSLDGTLGQFGISPLLFAAYQKIYYDFYRLSDREDNQPSKYNLDDFVYNETNIITFAEFIRRFGQLRYRPWKRDFYKNVQISPLMGSASVGSQPSSQSDLLNGVNQWLSGLTKTTTGSPNSSTAFPGGGQTSTDDVTPTAVRLQASASASTSSAAVAGIFNPANIRSLFAVEKLLEVTRRAGKHYDAQTLAHFGIKVPSGVDGEVIYLGEQNATIQIGDVVSTAETTTAPLGEIAGKGYSFGSGDSCKFEAKCHGVLMAIYSAEPEAKYYQSGLDKLNTLIDREDFFIPEYANLGMQPMFGYQTYLSDDVSNNAIIQGWQYRYAEFKQKYDRVIGGFEEGQSLRAWVLGGYPFAYNSDRQVKDFYISPGYLNGVMSYNYDGTNHGDVAIDTFIANHVFASDPLYHFFYFDVKKASKMTVYGLPQL